MSTLFCTQRPEACRPTSQSQTTEKQQGQILAKGPLTLHVTGKVFNSLIIVIDTRTCSVCLLIKGLASMFSS